MRNAIAVIGVSALLLLFLAPETIGADVPPIGGSNSQEITEAGVASSTSLIVEPSGWDLGSVKRGAFRKAFTVTNNTSRDVSLEVKFSCGKCFRLLSEAPAIVSGGSAPIEIEIDTQSISGKFKRMCVFGVKDSDITPTTVTITGTVDTPELLRPDQAIVDLGVVRYGETVTKTISVKREGGLSLEGHKASVDDSRIKAELFVDKDYPPLGDVSITYSPQNYPETVLTECRIESGDKVINRMIVTAKSTGEVEFRPREIILGHLQPNEEIEKTIQIDPGNMDNVTVDVLPSRIPAGMRIVLAQEPSGMWTVGVKGRCEEPESSTIEGAVRLKMNVRGCEDIGIPIFGTVAHNASESGAGM